MSGKKSTKKPKDKIPADALRYFALAVLAFILPFLVPEYQGHTGHMLVATERIATGPFVKTVVYMARHDRFGAVGVIVNRPLKEMTLSEFFEEYNLRPAGRRAEWHIISPSYAQGMTPKLQFRGMEHVLTVYRGGPAEENKLMMLHSADVLIDDSTEIPETGLALTKNINLLTDIAYGKGPRLSKTVLGYAGWSPMQLDHEIDSGAWHVIEYDEALVFPKDMTPEQVWQEATTRPRARTNDDHDQERRSLPPGAKVF